MTSKQNIVSNLFQLKHSPFVERLIIPVNNASGQLVANLEVIVADQVQNFSLVSLCAKWRKQFEWWFPKQFNVTTEGTEHWLKKGVIDAEDRLLFLITVAGAPIGHVGLYRFDYLTKSCELDNVLRGEHAPIGIMTYVTKTLMDWSVKKFGLKGMTLRVFSDNDRAIALYERVGFTKVKNIPLRKKSGSGEVVWEEDESLEEDDCERAYVLMQCVFS